MNTVTTTYDLPTFGDYGLAALKVLIIALFVVLLWVIIDKVTSFDDERELFVNKNMAYAVLRISIVLAQVIALVPLIAIRTGDFWPDIRPLLGWGAAVSVVILLLNVVLDRVLKSSGGRNQLTTITLPDAVLRGGFYVATGLIFHAALSGTADNLGQAIAASIVFALLGLVALVVGYVILGLIGPFRSRGKLPGNDLAASILSAGVVVGLGFILRLAIAGDFNGWASGIVGFAVTFVLGYVLLIILIFLLDLVLVRSHNLREIVNGNEAVAAAVMSSILVAVSIVIGSVTI